MPDARAHTTAFKATPVATPNAPRLSLATWREYALWSIERGGMERIVRESVQKRVKRVADDREGYDLGRVLEELARAAGRTELGLFILEQAQVCGSGMDETDLPRGDA